MAIPLSYNFRNLIVRRTTTIMTATGIAMTVAVLLAVLGLVAGLQSAFKATGDPSRVLVMRKGGNAEITSLFTQQQFQIVKSFPGIKIGVNGQPLASIELVTVISLPSVETPDGVNVTLRGLSPAGVAMRKIGMVSGEMFHPGQREVTVGKSIVKLVPSLQLGSQVRFGRGLWKVVGIMDCHGSANDSEIFADGPAVANDFNRPDTYSAGLLQTSDEITAKALINSLLSDPRLNVTPMTEKDYYANLMSSSETVAYLGYGVCFIMAFGSCFAAMNTMYAAVSRRSKEVGTLRILGFSRSSILFSFFLESVLLSLLGGVLACLIVLPLNGVTTALGNFSTFSQTSFNFKIGPQIMLVGLIFSAILGAVGGLLPARQAARKEILTALREV